ncbi:MAG: UDP-N-acetylmuramoyl-L-alanine--D-glutamate ligase, partial [Ruthenibacterium sp.]
AFDQKLIIIAGGSDKGISFAPLVPELLAHVKTIILTGATADKLESAIRADTGFAASGLVIQRASDMAHAVAQAQKAAKPGDIVSLSPACASFDSYPNFEVRGKHYKELVNAL